MDADSANLLLQALRECGLHGSVPLAAAERACAVPTDAPTLADALLTAGVLTPYQFKKIRSGRIGDLLFGPYFILDKLGEGGMGKVYRAAEGRAGRTVALKVIRPHLMANKIAVSRYKREAKAAKAVDDPHIVKLYDAGDAIDGRYFLAMEFIDGMDLSKLVKEFGRPPTTGLADPTEACEYVRQAALGLHQAHARGLVHRDIKPSNLLVSGERALTSTPGRAIVKILDMGLVRSFQDGDDASTSELTRDGTVVGTPDYMAPEQAKNSSTVDGRADLYSLGCTLYFLLRGQPPFPVGSPIEKLLQHQVDPAPDIRRARPDVSAEVAGLIARLLAKNPDDRYQTAAEVAEALAKIIHHDDLHQVVAATPPSTAATFEPFSLAAGPDSIATIEPPAPTAEVASARPSSTAVRLRIVQPTSGGTPSVHSTNTPTATPRPAVAVPAARTDADSPLESPRPGRRAPRNGVPGVSPRPPARRNRTRKPTRGDWRPLMIVAAAATVLMLITGAALSLSGRWNLTSPPISPTAKSTKSRPPAVTPATTDADNR